jgi:hypothetical protein
MKKYIKILACTGMLIVANACSDSFLDEKVLDKYSSETLNDKLGFEASIVGLHQHFGTLLRTTDDQTLIGMWQLGTDIVWAPAGRSNGNARPYFDYSQLNASDGASVKVWRYLYKLISNANILIESAEGDNTSGMTDVEKAVYNAEARFFRAYAYNMLVTLYGDVPLLTEPLTAPKTDFVRASVADVNAVIEEDLLFAVTNLPLIGQAAKDARANKAMARQLLAEVYLRIGENAKAEEQCTEIINGNSGALSLITSRYGVNAAKGGDAFSDMFIFGNQRRSQGNKEAIWVMETENPTDKPNTTADSPQQRRVWGAAYYDIQGMLPSDSTGGRGIGRVRLNNWVLYGLYENGDMRNSKYNIRRQYYFNNTDSKYSTIKGQPVPYGVDVEYTMADGTTKVKVLASDTIWRIPPSTTKWGQFDSRDTFGFGMWKDYILMRLGETYLLRAEARFKQSNFGGAADDINVLRARANATLVTAGDITDIHFILDERVRELLAEENRRMTLVRTGTLKDRIETRNGTAQLLGGNIETTNGFDETKHLLMPIPQSEIDLNKDAVLDQNNY